MFKGKKIKLREYRAEDIETVQKFINDPEVKKLLHAGIPYLYTLIR